jgi:putative FmdB family regulatory protein
MTHHWHSNLVSARSTDLEAVVPTYQYACTACGHQLDAVQSFTDEPLSECPECDGRLRKLFGSVGIVFKGSGFYRTDSRGTKADGAAPAKDGADSKPASEPKKAESSKEVATPSKPAAATTSANAA